MDALLRHRCAKVAGVEPPQQRGSSIGEVSIIGLDLAKNVFQADGAGFDGSVVFCRKRVAGAVAEVPGRAATLRSSDGGLRLVASLGVSDRRSGP